MGYTTNFTGKMAFSRQLTLDEYNELRGIYDNDNLKGAPNGYNQWVPTKDGRHLEWDGEEKFYNYIEWLEWLISDFFRPKGIELNGSIDWRGEDHEDAGTIQVIKNHMTIIEKTLVGKVVCPNCSHEFVPEGE